VVGRVIRAVAHVRPDIVTPAGVDLPALLAGRRIASVERRGKRIVFTLDGGDRFFVHLGMTGQLTVAPGNAPLLPHTHMILEIGDSQLRFRDARRFGGVWWLGQDAACDAAMGPEPLTLRPGQLFRRLSVTTRAVKNALMDQRVVAGLGNIYVDESLFAAGIHPLTCGDALTAEQAARLNRAIKATLRRAIRHRGSTLRDYMDADGRRAGFRSCTASTTARANPAARARRRSSASCSAGGQRTSARVSGARHERAAVRRGERVAVHGSHRQRAHFEVERRALRLPRRLGPQLGARAGRPPGGRCQAQADARAGPACRRG
jgi:formamidopyrimidine-DNA glycosylase